MSLRKPLDLYYMAISHPCRLVMLTIKQLKIESQVNIKTVDLLKGEHLKSDFESINPDHTLPTLVDHETNLTLWESRAIATYLLSKYEEKSSSLLPLDLKHRALVDRCIQHDGSSLFPALRVTYLPFFRENRKTEEAKVIVLKEKLRTMDKQFEGKTFAVGNSLTLADLCYLVTLDLFYHLRHLIHMQNESYPNLLRYINHLKDTLPYYKEVTEEPLRQYVGILEGLAKNVGQWSP